MILKLSSIHRSCFSTDLKAGDVFGLDSNYSEAVEKDRQTRFVGRTEQTKRSSIVLKICLPKVINEIRKNNKNRRIILHPDNVSSHTARETMDYFKDKDIERMSHCPYSPDLSPNDFFLFPYVKQKISGQRFSSPQEAVDGFQNYVSDIIFRVAKLFQELV
ncbi:Histone-lysine N-methyltransferase SETMAR like protein [Argiope bruennichi]|uniref:Histone-lysine N-methyltransferase SETMAR like protein n=1 Tax=Argiope bruennichi TaxID=94029 RepID=A0A8T0FWH0_ARGBR|nr:Histone-lysine N-methyltransferase SETMAR like protein [Argiope bruennichi]